MTEHLLTYTEKRTSQGWMLGTSALRLRDGTSLVYSPTRLLPAAAHEAVLQVGRPSVLLAPNHYHYLGLSEFRERYPEATCICSDQARPRLARKSPQVTFGSLAEVAERLPEGAAFLEPPGTRNGEVWLTVDGADGPIWLICDAFFNVPRHPRGFIGLFCRLTGTTPGLRIGLTWKLLALRDRHRYADWLLARLHETPPTALIPCHGNPAGGTDLAARLISLVERRLL